MRFAEMYTDVNAMLKGINKKSYVAQMKYFRETYGPVLDMLLDAAERDGPRATAAQLVESVQEAFSTKGKIPAYVQADLNVFTVYYVMPALALTEKPLHSELIDAICAVWEKTFRRGKIGYASYETISDSFQRSFLGIRL